jgi:peptidoglycan/xylan/chitin deacetylase (PgdA/CDA1 family)
LVLDKIKMKRTDMASRSLTQKKASDTEPTTLQSPSAGPLGTALAPPAYGIGVVDRASVAGAPKIGLAQQPFITPLGPDGGFGGLLERDRQDGKERTFALTFDDGPHIAELGTGKNLTEKVLDTLKAKSVKAGFFVQTGVSIRGANRIGKKLIARMHAEGHKVGIHTGGKVDHEKHTLAQNAGRLEGELESAKKYIGTQTGEVPTLVRPPEGVFDKDVSATYAKVSLTNLLWDMDVDQGYDRSLDFLKARIESEMLRVQRARWKPTTSSPHIVVLFHDIKSGTAENIGPLIEHIITTTTTISAGKDHATFAAP